MSNPFNLPGPDFLVFYAITAAIVLALLYVVRSAAESGPAPRIDTSDPYLIAYLRGGKNEAARVATVTLIDRGILNADETDGTVKVRAGTAVVRRPMEKEVVRLFARPQPAAEIFTDLGLETVCREYDAQLTELGLLPDPERVAARLRWFLLSLLVLLGLSVTKILVALSRGRGNVAFLIVLTVVAVVAAFKLTNPRLTTRGNALLADLRRLFARLRQRAPRLVRGGATADAALLAAVFGLAALPTATFAYAQKLYPKSGSGTSSNCGSSCGSSCGGGGCGGGCGGCGGG